MFLIFSSDGGGKIVIRKSESQSFLTFKNITADFAGMYQCTASNDLDVLYTAGRLKIVGM